MKRWLSLLLCVAFAGSLFPFAMAEDETADARLKRVTEQVKTTLDLDTDHFTDFYGDLSEQELGNIWNLNWSGDGVSLNVEALEDGTVVSYWSNDGGEIYSYSQNLPAFPRTDPAGAKAAAASFLEKVLDNKTESVELKEPTDKQLRSSSVRFYGNLLLNGLPSPLSYSVTVRGSDNTVTSFRRDAPSRTFLGNIPSPVPAVTKADAAAKLKGTEKLELLYVLDQAEEGQPDRVVLRYVPKTEGTWAVDAQTGEAKDISGGDVGLYRNASATMEEEDTAADMGSGASMKSLNAVEQAGVEKLEGVLDRETLDRAVRAESAYMLDAYTVQSANYRLVKEDDGRGGEREVVICTLRYSAGESADQPLYGEDIAVAGTAAAGRLSTETLYDRTFTVDARTGAVRILYSAEGWQKNREVFVSADRAREIAKNFLFRFAGSAPVDAAKLELYDSADDTANGSASYGFTFARKENGIFFPADSITIRVDCATGAVSGINYTWHENLTSFPAPRGLVSADAALNAWADTWETVLAYRLLPRSLDASVPAEARLISLGMTKFYDLFLSYRFERPEGTDFEAYRNCPGIDAQTGKPAALPGWTEEKLSYSDIGGNAAEADILKLAEYGIGYAGGVFGPDKSATQWDLVCLLASAQGIRTDPEKAAEEEKDSAYNTAVYMGALRRSERNEDAALTRGETIKILLNAAGFRDAAELKGIYRTDYLDAVSIPAGDLGYAAIAQGLGMASGTYAAGKTLTRGAAASLLCRLMERETA